MSIIKRLTMAAATAAFVTGFFTASAQAAIYVLIPGVGGDVATGYDDGKHFIADSFSFAVEREMKESGEKSSVSLSLAAGSDTLDLLVAAVDGTSVGDVVIELYEEDGASGKPICYLRYKLERTFIKSWSISGDADDRPGTEVVMEFDSIQELR